MCALALRARCPPAPLTATNAGVDAESTLERGFADEARYLAHVKCATYVAKRLYDVRESVSPRMRYRRDRGPDVEAGASMYLFHERAAVYVPFRWFWQCVVLAGPLREGGAPRDWFRRVTDPGEDGALVECENYAHSLRRAKTLAAGGDPHAPPDVTVHKLLRTSRHLYRQSDGLQAQVVCAQVVFLRARSVSRALVCAQVVAICETRAARSFCLGRWRH